MKDLIYDRRKGSLNRTVYKRYVLDDGWNLPKEVVEAIDDMAYSLGTNRSSLINQILAERVSMMTPEMRMRDIFERIERLMSGCPVTVTQSGGSAMMLKSPLKYKDRPTVNYSVELTRSFEGTVGRLKISLRTQSESLIAIFSFSYVIIFSHQKIPEQFSHSFFVIGN